MKACFKKIRLDRRGFTLVELMVVVAIIGILASIAIPNFTKQQAKARQSEAKIALASIYTVEQSFSAENSSYTACLSNIGYAPTTGSKLYYSTGFNGGNSGAGCGPAGGLNCSFFDWTGNANTTGCGAPAANIQYFDATASANGTHTTNANISVNTVTQTTFTAGAAGQISSGFSGFDIWTIDQTRALKNTVGGI
jgi:type IV pilus assembly protein PilA